MYGYGATGHNYIALETTTTSGAFAKNLVNHVYIYTGGLSIGKHISGMCKIFVRVNGGPDGNSQIELTTNKEVEYKKITSSYVKGTFKGDTSSGRTITGSFVFKRTPDGTYPLADPRY